MRYKENENNSSFLPYRDADLSSSSYSSDSRLACMTDLCAPVAYSDSIYDSRSGHVGVCAGTREDFQS